MPAASLSYLQPDPARPVAVQSTSLSLDVLGRFLCNTLDEALHVPSTDEPAFDLTADFDAIVIGSGMYGAYCAARLWRNGAKVLVLEAGPFLISEHYQNLPNVGLGTGGAADGRPGSNPEAERVEDQVWGLPWRGNQLFARQAFCVGGKALFWGGWAPRLNDDVLAGPLTAQGAGWSPAAADYLKTFYERVELQIGVRELTVGAGGGAPTAEIRTDLFNDPDKNTLTRALQPKLEALVGDLSVAVDGREVQTTIESIQPALIAVQADAPASGLFSFDKFSSLPVLAEAVRGDIERSGNSDQTRRLFLVPNVRVLALASQPTAIDQRRVTGLGVWDSQRRRVIDVPPGCQVVLALGAIESTRLALESFGDIAPLNGLMGRNLMAHVRNNVSMRIRRAAIAVSDLEILQTSAFHIVGRASTGGRYHLQFYAGFQPGPNAEAVLYRMIPDIDSVTAQLQNQDPEWVAITFRGIGEMVGRTDLPPGDPGASYINLSQEFDQFGQRRAWVHYVQQDDDRQVFDEMDQAAFAIARALAGSDDAIQYWDEQNRRWEAENPYRPGAGRYGTLKQEGGMRDPLGTTYHDSGTLWMGDDPAQSVTDSSGRFHQAPNVFCVDQAVFPRVGSANPVLTGLTLARRAAESIVNDALVVVEETDEDGRVTGLFHQPEDDFTALFVFNRDPTFNRDALLPRGWRHVGAGGFVRFGLVLEATGGIGLLCYEAQEFDDMTVRLQWRAPTIRNNAGVYVRLPRERLGDVATLIKTGYEIQIDNSGERPGPDESLPNFPFPAERFNPYHQTGAIYPVHSQNPDGSVFPAAADLPDPNGHPSVQPIPTRALSAWNDLEIRVGGNRVRVLLNGVAVLADGDYVDRRNAYPRGLIGLQNHVKGARVQFRHVRVKPGMPPF